MSLSRCNISVCQKDDGVLFRVEGNATRIQSPALRLFAEQCIAAGRRKFRFHLGECRYMDSTFVGTLLCLSRTLNQRGRMGLSLISLSGECRRLLYQMGIEGMIPVAETGETMEGPWAPLGEGPSDVFAFQKVMVDAHQELANIPGPAGEQFRAVAEGLASEMRKKLTD